MARAVRIGNCSGFYGDRFSAMREMLEGGELDVLTGDYLAELTMLLLWRSAAKDPDRGYGTSFVRQLEDCLELAWERGVRIVANAGGLNPAGCANAVRELAGKLGLRVNVAHVEGDDLLPRRDELAAEGIKLPADTVTANAYLGGWGIATALDRGAQVVVTGRVTDAALVIGPAAWYHGWAVDDYDALAGALVAGHVLECGAQASGGNYSFFTEVPGIEHVGFPYAEVFEDGTSVITKQDGTGGLVDIGTVTAQLLYEIGPPLYLNPDVTAEFGSVELNQEGPDRVRITGPGGGAVRGHRPPEHTKVAVNTLGGFRNSMTFLLTGLDIEAKADLVRRQLAPRLDGIGDVDFSLARTDHDNPVTNEQATARLTVTVKDHDGARIGREFSSAAVELALASYPGATMTTPPGDATPYGVYQPLLLPNHLVTQRVVTDDGTAVDIEPPAGAAIERARLLPRRPPADPPEDWGPIWHVPLGSLVGARSGDKGGDANVGLWVATDAAYHWLRHELDVDCFKALLPETAGLDVTRYELPNLRALNFVVAGLLGDGVAASTRQDPQAKGLGEWLRSRYMEIPVALLEA
ncbi:MAG TPA: acyclic terpene utilization AtuA family protein [Mycobacteriales bacterium]|nr:acyclic terpene utilization AtuA family protein [Mycobacteriales bacterium]